MREKKVRVSILYDNREADMKCAKAKTCGFVYSSTIYILVDMRYIDKNTLFLSVWGVAEKCSWVF